MRFLLVLCEWRNLLHQAAEADSAARAEEAAGLALPPKERVQPCSSVAPAHDRLRVLPLHTRTATSGGVGLQTSDNHEMLSQTETFIRSSGLAVVEIQFQFTMPFLISFQCSVKTHKYRYPPPHWCQLIQNITESILKALMN